MGYFSVKESPATREDRAFDGIYNGELGEDEEKDIVGRADNLSRAIAITIKIGERLLFPLTDRI